MKLMKKAIALAIMSVAALGAQAATQGDPSATSSVATFQNSIGVAAPVRTIRIFGVQDAVLTSASGNVDFFWGNGQGVNDGFCVADSTGAAVQVTVVSTNGIGTVGGESFKAINSATGADVSYGMNFKVGSGAWLNTSTAANNILAVPSGTTQTDLVNCATPNVQKSIFTWGGWTPGTNGVYTDVVTLTATPL